jgi:filamentous hemagglutinin family protein
MKWPSRRISNFVALSTGVLFIVGAGAGWAQVVLDGTLGASGPLTGPDFSITADLGLRRGNNLFHSFSQFDLKAGDTAAFSGPGNIQNILSRVTGSQASRIDGTIRSDIVGANFYLINPKGVVFGPNAVVDVSGAFAASGADYLKLADDARFVAALDADDSVLSSAPVAAFGFLSGSGGGIEVHGSLTAGRDASLSLVGSSVSIRDGARLEAANGQIQLRGVGLAGEVEVPPPGPVGIPGDTLPDRGGGAGSIVIRGGRLVINDATINATTSGGEVDVALTGSMEVVNGGQIVTGSTGTTRGGSILIDVPELSVDGQDGPLPTRIAAETRSGNPEAVGGNIVLNAESVEVRRGAEISVSSFGAANAGRLEINAGILRMEGSDRPRFPTEVSANASPVIGGPSGAGGQIVIRTDSVEISKFAGILAATVGDAAAGAVDIETGQLKLVDGAVTTFTASAGSGGEIRIRASELTLDGPFATISAFTTGLDGQSPAGNGGVIRIEAGRLELLNDAGISATTIGDGRGGNIEITAGAMLLDAATFQPGSIPGITAASNPPFFGNSEGGKGGDISIEAGALTLRNGMIISTSTATAGDGGNIHIAAESVDMDSRSSIQSESHNVGVAGTISLASAADIRLNNQSVISTSAPQSSGGDIQVEAGDEIRLVDSQITAQAGPGGGGNISVMAPSLIYLLDGTLTAQAVGDGGNLNIDPVFFILNRSSLISRSSSANGGNITILSDYFFLSGSTIDASAPFGLPGTVSVSAPEVDLSGSLIGLPSSLLGIDTQLRPDCAVRGTENISSFVVLGRGGLPPTPGGFVPSGLPPTLDETQ